MSPVYRDMLQALAKNGYQIASVKREKDSLMKFLTAVSDVDVAIHSLGTVRTLFPEFCEIDSGTKPRADQEPSSS